MPLFKCGTCHHEWEGPHQRDLCDWCKCIGTIIEKKTPFEKYLDDRRNKKRKGEFNADDYNG